MQTAKGYIKRCTCIRMYFYVDINLCMHGCVLMHVRPIKTWHDMACERVIHPIGKQDQGIERSLEKGDHLALLLI